MPFALDSFLEQLQLAVIMTVDEGRAWLERQPLDRRPFDSDTFAAALVDCGKLTRYQADELLARRGRMLSLGDYTLEERLGIGAMGQVFRARHRKMNRVVALKVLQSALARSPEVVSRFQREVQAAARLKHPHVVSALDASEHEGVHFLVMEYVEGCDLAQLVKRSGPLPLRLTVDYMLQAARGLEHAHAEGIVHRDIKPANLLLDKRGVIKILDLGAARMESDWGEPLDADDEGLTHTGNILGTVDYMAPEQAMNLNRADARADIYSLGCTLYRLVTGRRIFAGDTVLERILAHRELPPPRLGDVLPAIPERLEAAFARMVAKRPEDRYSTTSDLIYDLELVLAEMPQSAASDMIEVRGPDSEPSASQRQTEVAPTVWSDTPEKFETADDGRPFQLVPRGGATTLAELPVEAGAKLTKAPAQPDWLWPLLASVFLLPILAIALLGGTTKPASSTAADPLDPIRKRERWIADPPLSERGMNQVRQDFEQAMRDWQQSMSHWQQPEPHAQFDQHGGLTAEWLDEAIKQFEQSIRAPTHDKPAEALEKQSLENR